jgi:PilZ domain
MQVSSSDELDDKRLELSPLPSTHIQTSLDRKKQVQAANRDRAGGLSDTASCRSFAYGHIEDVRVTMSIEVTAQKSNCIDCIHCFVMIDQEAKRKSMKQRNFQRFSDKSLVTFSNGAVQGEGRLGNLSLGGAAVFSDVAIARGSYLTLTIRGQADAIEIELAPVRWVKQGSFGVEFWIAAESQRRLKRYIGALEKTSEAT